MSGCCRCRTYKKSPLKGIALPSPFSVSKAPKNNIIVHLFMLQIKEKIPKDNVITSGIMGKF